MSLLIFLLLDLEISDREMLTSSMIIVDLSVLPQSSISFCLMYFDALFLGAYVSRIDLCSQRMDLFIIIYDLSIIFLFYFLTGYSRAYFRTF